jgi:hypothetical protein
MSEVLGNPSEELRNVLSVGQFPETLGECIDLYYTERQKRLALERVVEEKKTVEQALQTKIMSMLSNSHQEGAKGTICTCAITRRTIADVKDWRLLHAYIQDTGAFDLLHKRISDSAFRERLDAGTEVPGVFPKEIVGLSFNKSGGK